MKTNFCILLIFLNTLCLFSYGQQKDWSLDLYKDGLKMFEQKRYKEADSLFSISAKLTPHPDTYFNLALTRYRLNDFCGYCANMDSARKLHDIEAQKLFALKCTKRDSINYPASSTKDTLRWAILTKETCTDRKEMAFYTKNKRSDDITAFYIQLNDSSELKAEDLEKEFPDIKKINSQNFIYTVVEEMPMFPGGDKARIRFLVDNIRYPQLAKENGIQGTVYITFTVDEHGGVSDVKVARGIGGGCDEEAIRVVKIMPKWNPGRSGGTPVKVKFFMQIRFTLN